MRSRERSRFSIQDGGDKETPSLQAKRFAETIVGHVHTANSQS